MTLWERLGTSGSSLAVVVVATASGYALVIALTRVAGPRSLAKMSSFDFAATVAIGSILASTAVGSVQLAEGAMALLVLFGLQAVIAALRRRGALGGWVDNRPVLLMAGPKVLESQMRRSRVSREELYSQLRAAGIQQLQQVQAVVLETTGDLSVLTCDRPTDPELLRDVRGAEQLTGAAQPGA